MPARQWVTPENTQPDSLSKEACAIINRAIRNLVKYHDMEPNYENIMRIRTAYNPTKCAIDLIDYMLGYLGNL
jgi:hypothetical protein